MVNFKITKTEEINNKLFVAVDCEGKEETFQFPIIDLEINPETEQPMFIHRIKHLLDRTYHPTKTKKTKKFLKTFVDLEFDTENVADLSKKAQKEAWRKKNKEKGEVCYEKLHPEEYAKVMTDLKARRKVKTDAKHKEKFDRQKGEMDVKIKNKSNGCEYPYKGKK